MTPRKRSTLITSHRSQADFGLRVLFFALAPQGIVRAAALFPVGATLATTALALIGFVGGEAIRGRAARWPFVGRLLSREFALEAYYRAHPPRPFLYYVLYPLLFPYWLLQGDARREFWLFKGYTLLSFCLLLASVAWQYFAAWPPELDLLDFAPVTAVTFGVEALLVLALLMPIATTVVGFHQSFRRRRLVALLLIGLASTGYAVGRLALRRDPVVSYSTRQRIQLRTHAAPQRARDAQRAALGVALASLHAGQGTAGGREGAEGRIDGEPLTRARGALEAFYKPDEAFAFELWGTPRADPRMLVLYYEGRRGLPPIWAAVDASGAEVADPHALSPRAREAMRLKEP